VFGEIVVWWQQNGREPKSFGRKFYFAEHNMMFAQKAEGRADELLLSFLCSQQHKHKIVFLSQIVSLRVEKKVFDAFNPTALIFLHSVGDVMLRESERKSRYRG
jgi:hypothetical protein